MDLSSAILIIKIVLYFWIINVLFGLPITLIVNKDKRDGYGMWTQIFGCSIQIIVWGWLYYTHLFNYVSENLILIIIFWYLIFYLYIWLSKISLISILKKISNLIYTEIFFISVYLLVCIIFFFPQRSFAPFIPSYNVNHDPIAILNISKGIKNNVNFFVNDYAKIPYYPSVVNGMPLGFSLMSTVLNQVTKIDLYKVVPVLNVLIIALVVIPLYSICRFFIKKKFNRQKVAFFTAFTSIFSYLVIQYVNQSFYNQILLTPFLFGIIWVSQKYFYEQSKFNKENYIIFPLLLSASFMAYSYTIFIWLIPYLLMYILKNLLILKIVIKRFSVAFFATIILSIAFIKPISKIYYDGIFNNKGTELSFFGANGNSIGYAPFFSSLSTWIGLDFRINEIIYYKLSTVITLFVIISIIILVIKLKRSYVNYVDFIILIITFILPILFFRHIANSPYYYGKTLYYFSFIFSCLLLLLSYKVLFSSRFFKSRIILICTIGITIVYINNSLRSINYYGDPPYTKFAAIEDITKQLKILGIKKVIAIDDEDWLKYFLYDYGSCVTFVRSYPCGLNNIKTIEGDGSMVLEKKYIYMVGNDYQEKITDQSSAILLYENKYYKVLQY